MVTKIDKQNMKKTILEFPSQFQIGWHLAENVRVKERCERVIICGMGGSALPGDILRMWLKDKGVILPLLIHRDYNLPDNVSKKDLIICISYSGNTEETISSFEKARKQKLPLIAITSGGKLNSLSKANDIPFVKIPRGYQPRTALGLQVAALMRILTNLKLIGAAKDILSLEKQLSPKDLEKQGRELANKIKGKVPVIYASSDFKGVARIWKIKFNENAKRPAFFNFFPELNHNEMIGFSKTQKNFHLIILKNKGDHPRTKKRMQLTGDLMERRIGVDFIEIKGKDILTKVFSSILLSDWTSYYLALQDKIDPSPVLLVEQLKKRMK